jgi:CubicO group peptidase (beta-lactamase class C family)
MNLNLRVCSYHTSLPAILAIAFVACGHPSPAPDPHIAAVIDSLRPMIAVQGEPPVRWTLAERMRHYHVPGVSIAVIDSGRIVWAKGFGLKSLGGTDSVTPTTIFEAGSVSKPTFALGVMRLVQDGTLNLDENVNDKLTSWHVPDNRFTTHEKVTLRRILSHNAGLTVHGFPGYETGSPIPTVPQVLDGIKPANTAPVRVDTFPGAISRYSGGGTTIAMLLVTDVTKEPFPEFMQRTVLGPAGMSHSTYEQPLPASRASDAASGYDQTGEAIKGKYHTYPEMSAAGLWTTPSDLATLAIVLQHTYAGQSSAIISQATFKQMLTIQKPPFGIGYVVTGSGPTLEFSHGGDDAGFVTSFIAFAERGQGLAIMANGENEGLLGEITTAVASAYGWPNHQQQVRTPVPLSAQVLGSLAGTYKITIPDNPSGTLTVMSDGKRLSVLESWRGVADTTELFAESDSTFLTVDDGSPIAFTPGGITIYGYYHGVKLK